MKKTIWIVALLIVFGGGYWYLNSVDQNEGIKIISPSLDDEFTIGEKMIIEWENNTNNSNLDGLLNRSEIIIALKVTSSNGESWVDNITYDAPNTGRYEWVVNTETPGYKYQIEIYPFGARELIERSGAFFIEGNDKSENDPDITWIKYEGQFKDYINFEYPSNLNLSEGSSHFVFSIDLRDFEDGIDTEFRIINWNNEPFGIERYYEEGFYNSGYTEVGGKQAVKLSGVSTPNFQLPAREVEIILVNDINITNYKKGQNDEVFDKFLNSISFN